MSKLSFSGTASAAASTIADSIFTKSLSQMIKGIRGSKDKNQHEYIAQCLADIKKELASLDYDYKAEALKKLIFLQMMGYDLSWAAFHIIEVMSAPWFGHRRIGFLAASLAFNQTTELILMTTNLLQKAFQQQSIGQIAISNPRLAEGIQYEIGSAISCFSSIVTPELANDLLQDVMNLLNNPRPYIRKRAILALYSIFHKHPPALRIAFDSLLDKLGDENASVNGSVVYVLCELISKTPKNYLDLAPQFFHILTSSSNNWVLIKVVKIMGFLVQFEPRLAKKLQDPLSSIITTTPAKSLMYECINTLLCGQIGSRAVVRLCLDKLRELVESADQNLKYLGLLGLNKLINSFPRIVVQHKDLILDCLNDHDITIRTRALDLVSHLVTPGNLPGVVKKLLQHINAIASPGVNSLASPSQAASNQGSAVKNDKKWHSNQYHNIVISRILDLCTQDQYAMIADFEWFFYTLLDFTHIKGVSTENVLAIQHIMKDLLISIPDLRPFAINQLCTFILGLNLTASKKIDLSTTTNPNAPPPISTCHLLQDIYQYTLLHELQLTETIGHSITMHNTQSKLKKQALQQLHNQKQHQYKQISSTYMQFNPMVEVLSTLAWCIGEYIGFAHSHQQLAECFLLHPCLPFLSSSTQSAFLFASVKVLYNSFQQPWFKTREEALEYEAIQSEMYRDALQQSKALKKSSILPSDFDIEDAENYQQKFTHSDNEDEDDDEDDENEHEIKGGQIALSALGHHIVIGRTFPQHVIFLETISGVILSGLNMLHYHTPYPEVQDRSHIFFHYSLWFFGKLGSEFNSGGVLGLGLPAATQPAQGSASPSTTSSPKKPSSPSSPSSPTIVSKLAPDTTASQLNDLTSLIFKEQRQNTALDALIGVSNDDIDNRGDKIQDQFNFDPLLDSTASPTLGAAVAPAPAVAVNLLDQINTQKEYSQEFVQTIETCIQYLAPLFSEEMLPISAKTQRKVPVPAGLDLEECIYDLELDQDKPLFDSKTHPLFPIGLHLVSSNYISSKDLDKREAAMGVNVNASSSLSPSANSMSSADYTTGSNVKTSYNDDDDDDLFAPKKVKVIKKGEATDLQTRHKDDPFYIGSSTKTTKTTKKKGNTNGLVNATLTLDDLEGGDDDGDDLKASGKKGGKKMTIKKTQTKAVIDLDGDDDGISLLSKAPKGGKGPAKDPLDDLLEPVKPVKGKKKKAAVVVEDEAVEKPKKKVIKKKTTANQEQEQPQQQQQQQSGPLAPFVPPSGTIPLYSSEQVSVYARARPYLQDIDLDQEAVAQPIILIAVTIVTNPVVESYNNQDGLSIPMFQLSIHGNKATQVQVSPVPQPSALAQSVVGNNANSVHVQSKGISQTNSATVYFAIQWASANISTSSRYFDFDLKFMLNGELIQYINPVTNHNQFQLPTSVFIQPYKMSMNAVQSLLLSPENQCTASETYIALCSDQQEIMSVLKGTEVALNTALVEAANKTAVYYGRCITLPPDANHIFVYIKYTGSDDNRVHITVKTSVQVLSQKLIQDLIGLLGLEDERDVDE